MEANHVPRVSIGLPVYNGQRYLSQALDSLLQQTFDDFEIIISDNCSSDNTEAICRESTKRDPRVRYIRQQQNLGAIGNFNFVFSRARGEYFKWAAYDDVCHPTFLEACVQVLDENSQVIWCHCESDQIDESGESWLNVISPDESDAIELVDGRPRWVGHPRTDHDSSDASKRFAGVLLGTTWAADSYGLNRTAALRKTRMLLPYYGAEKVLLGELALQGPYYHISERLFEQRVHAEASGNIQTSEFQFAFAVGGNSRAFVPTRLSLLFGHLRAIRRAEIPTWQRIKCLAVVFRYLLQVAKWKRIVGASLRRSGVGGEGYRKMKQKSDLIRDTN